MKSFISGKVRREGGNPVKRKPSRTLAERMNPEVLHIVVVYNGLKWLPELLESVRASNTGEVWAIDHGSTDGSWAWLKDNLPENNRTQGPNAGFGLGNNRGMEEAIRRQVDAVHLLNQDARVDPEGMSKMAQWLVERTRAGHAMDVASPIHWDWNGEEPYVHFDQRYARGWRAHSTPFEVPFIHAASWLMSLETVQTVGGFNPAFFMYGEDNEWAHRLKKAGGRFWIHPDGALYHDEKPKPWPQPVVLERMAFADEVIRFFDSTTPPEVWSRSVWRRTLMRAMHPDRWLDVLSGAMWKGERAARQRVQKDVVKWAARRDALQHEQSPHLTP